VCSAAVPVLQRLQWRAAYRQVSSVTSRRLRTSESRRTRPIQRESSRRALHVVPHALLLQHAPNPSEALRPQQADSRSIGSEVRRQTARNLSASSGVSRGDAERAARGGFARAAALGGRIAG
jgi:hypothetical protein